MEFYLIHSLFEDKRHRETYSIKIITDCAQDNLELRIPSIENSIKKRICKLAFRSLNGSGRIAPVDVKRAGPVTVLARIHVIIP